MANSESRSLIAALAAATGLMISPESLTVLGNGVGRVGISFLAALLVAFVVHLFTAFGYVHVFSRFPGSAGEARFIKDTLGSVPAVSLPLCSKVVFTVCAATGMLATAGYVFNEVFLRSFPNLGFSFFLLGVLITVNLVNRRVSEAAQLFFVLVAVCGLIFLCAVGILGLSSSQPVDRASDFSTLGTISVVPFGLALFVGYDVAGLVLDNRVTGKTRVSTPMTGAIVLVGMVLCLWGAVSLIYVSQDRLADTTIPYTVAARAVLGQKGRLCMGAVIIAGSCAAVNALLMGVSRMTKSMAAHGMLPSFLAAAHGRAPVPLLILGLGTGAMMGIGMAGEPVLEIYAKSALVLWLLTYALVNLCLLIPRARLSDHPPGHDIPGYPISTIVAFSVIAAGTASLVWADEHSALLLRATGALFAIALLLSFAWAILDVRRDRPRA